MIFVVASLPSSKYIPHGYDWYYLFMAKVKKKKAIKMKFTVAKQRWLIWLIYNKRQKEKKEKSLFFSFL